MDHLQTRGVKVIPVPEIQEIIPQLQREFFDTCDNFPEFKKSDKRSYVMGGFCALGNPSSFHNPLVRKLREWCQVAVIPEMKSLADGRKLEQIIDRMMYRPAGVTPIRESWHRDEAPQALKDDITFGGWLNLDNESQWFSCAPGTHCRTGCGGGGFSKQNREEVKKILQQHPKELIEVPPGHILVFYETILHEVLSRKVKYESIRLFLGWRLTYGDEPLYLSNLDAAKNFGVPRLKSGQIPAMYSVLHWTNWVDKLEKFSRYHMIDACLTNKFRNSTGTTHRIVIRFLPNLLELKLETPRKYSVRELAVFTPNKSWDLLVPGRSKKTTRYSIL